MRFFSHIRAAVVIVLATVVLLVLTMPISVVVNGLGYPGFQVLAGSRLLKGQGIYSDADGSLLVNWRWCPTKGLLSACVAASRNRTYMHARISAGFGGIQLREGTFSGVDVADLGLTGSALHATLAGQIAEATLPWGQCLQRALISAQGELRVAGLTVAGNREKDLKLQLVGDGKQGFRLAGEEFSGDFVIAGSQLSGTVAVAEHLAPIDTRKLMKPTQLGSGNGYSLDVSQKLSCR